jgi:signal transduction histidine kinase
MNNPAWKPEKSIEVVYAALIWIALFELDLLAGFVLKPVPQSIEYYHIALGLTVIGCLVIPALGAKPIVHDIQEICFYDVLVQVFGVMTFVPGQTPTTYLIMAKMVIILKLLRLLWPMMRIFGNLPAHWPVFGLLGILRLCFFRKSIAQLEPGQAQRTYYILCLMPGIAFLLQVIWVELRIPLPHVVIALLALFGTRWLTGRMEANEAARIAAEIAKVEANKNSEIAQREVEFVSARLKDQQIIEAQNAELAASNRRLAQLNATLKNRNAELQALYEQRDELAQTLAARNDRLGDAIHDQRNNTITMGFRAKELRSRALDENQVETATLLVDEIDDLSRQLTLILHAAKLENHFPRLPGKQIIVAKSFCHYLFERLNPVALQYEVTLRCKYPQSNEPLAIETDEEIFKRIVINLLLNAIKYAGPNRDACITFYGGPDGCYVHVYDTGPGMEDLNGPDRVENFDILTERVAKAHVLRENQNTDPRHPTSGNGIGLLNVSRLCHDLGVIIKLRSKPGFGTDFCMKFPLAVPEMPTEN